MASRTDSQECDYRPLLLNYRHAVPDLEVAYSYSAASQLNIIVGDLENVAPAASDIAYLTKTYNAAKGGED